MGSSKAARPPGETHPSWAEVTNRFSPGRRWPAQSEAASCLWGPDVHLMMLWVRGEKGEYRRINLIKLLGFGTRHSSY